ncbi:Dyp-type peroxidase [Aestuariimicrobium sp. Y1814]|uniref:Dyp-type peroxidase n=1 Tax=Aestuariimicrobium sp. Y1814 TaxID=3418742 RepID=UPI003DA70E25
MTEQGYPGLGRRGFFGLAGAGAAGAVALGAVAARGGNQGQASAKTPDGGDPRGRSYSPHETHQSGIITPVPAATTLVALDLNPGTTPDALRRLLTILSHDIEALMAGRPVPGDPLPDLAQANVSLTVTVGLGPGVFRIPGLAGLVPDGLAEVPPMAHDQLQPRWSGGDLLLMVSADDATTVAYAVRILTRDARTFTTVRWTQPASWRGVDAEGTPITGRNLFGQVDGTGNTVAGAAEVIWADGSQPWFAGGTTLVVRRIEMNLTTWDELVRDRQQAVMGRTLADGAPLSGGVESDDLDLSATTDDGQPVIALDAHARLAHPSQNRGRTMFRRSMNYTHHEYADGVAVTSAGLVFLAFQHSIPEVFTPVQQRLDQADALNEWTTAIGSAVFAVPGGWEPGGIVAQGLFS